MRREECGHRSPVGRMAASNLDLRKVALRGVHGDPFCRSQADLLGGELLYHDHGAATTRTWPRTGGRPLCVLRRGLRAGRLRQHPAADRYRLSPPWRGKKAEVTDAHKATRQYMQ